jgi:hypothetical protein
MDPQVSSAQAKQASFSSKMEGLMKANSLDYRLPPALSVVTKRQMIRHNFNQDTYVSGQGGQMTVVLNSGDMYVDGRNSYLSFKVVASAAATFGTGSAANIIDRIRFTTESGTEIERVENLNLFRRHADRHMCSQGWLDAYGQVVGYTPSYQEAEMKSEIATSVKLDGVDPAVTPQIIAKKGVPVNLNDGNLVVQYCIPMSKLLGLFGSEKLLPGLGLISGGRIEIGLAPSADALVWGGVAGTFSVQNIHIIADSYQLSDAVLKTLNQTSATRSLEVVFDTYDHVQRPEATAQLNLDSKRAVSRAQWAFATTRLTASLGNSTADTFSSEKFKVEQQQWQLAGLFLPNNPIEGSILAADFFEVGEHFQNAQYVFGKVRHCLDENSVSLDKFKGVVTYGPAATSRKTDSGEGDGLCACVLERSAVLQGSGLPVSGSRILQLRARYFDAQPRTIDLFMVYEKLARVFLDRAIIKE